MHFIEIPKFVKKNPNTDARLEQWLWLLAGREDKLEMAKKKNEQIQSAIDLVKRMSMSEKEWYLYRSRQMAIMDYNVGMNNARKEGENIGLQEGKSIGLQEGEAIGQKKKQLEIAKNLLKLGMKLEDIITATGLTEKELLSSEEELS